MPKTEAITPQQIQEISDWLIDAALGTTELPELLIGFCKQLCDAGMDLRRVTVGTLILHPTQESQTVRWTRGKGLEIEAFAVGSQDRPQWQQSPIRTAIENHGVPIRRRLEGLEMELDYPILAELKADGYTDYVALATRFDAYSRPGLTTGTIVTWATDRRGGFRDEEVAVIARLQPRFAVAVKCAILPQIAQDVVNVYLGADAGRRVLSGAVDRGSIDHIDAILFFCDLRGFTALADRMDLKELIALLDAYFDAIVGPIADNDGQVLKFLGDGLLATFALDGADHGKLCDRALDAAIDALASIDAINRERAKDRAPTLDLDIALHQGQVIYGNVGSHDRLDFTVIGPAVNEASRMETLCDELGVHVVISESFVACAGPETMARCRSLGRHTLRGVGADRELFTLDHSDPE